MVCAFLGLVPLVLLLQSAWIFGQNLGGLKWLPSNEHRKELDNGNAV